MLACFGEIYGEKDGQVTASKLPKACCFKCFRNSQFNYHTNLRFTIIMLLAKLFQIFLYLSLATPRVYSR